MATGGRGRGQHKEMTDEMQDKLLKDPRVQASIKQAGTDALSDPAVQKMIVDACQEHFPEYAEAAKNKVKDWAKDPAVQAKAKKYAGVALAFVGSAGDQVLKQIEQGPTGVRLLAFLGSTASAVNAVLSLINIFRVFGHAILYMVSVYQFIFSVTTVLFEMKPEWVTSIEDKLHIPVSKYQDMLLDNAKFLSLVGGRGMFYIFQGTLWLAFASFSDFVNLLIGLFLVFIGVVHVLMHFGVAPKDVATKMRNGYMHVRGPGEP
mmetsp:Transcript_69382/g.136151  ORF Transcript_69382/g.136151 Transcript_69382/m.136151 type:complete len:262 (-) Transcript_69382:105-890(-)